MAAVLETTDATPTVFHVSALQTALGEVPYALLRASDVRLLHFSSVPLQRDESREGSAIAAVVANK